MGQGVVVRRYRDVSQSSDSGPTASPREDFLVHPHCPAFCPLSCRVFCTALINLIVFCSVSTQILTEGLNLYIHRAGSPVLMSTSQIF